jgi:hypothetical protein
MHKYSDRAREILEQSVIDANCTGEQFIREHDQLERFIFEEDCVRTLEVMSSLAASNTRILYPSMISL